MQSSAEQIGYIVGIILGVLFFIGVLAFGIFAVVKAFTKKTTGWIIAGSIGGVFALFIGGCLAIGFLGGVVRAIRTSNGSSESAKSDSVAIGSQTLEGKSIGYSIKVPSNWRIQRDKKSFDILANYQSVYVGVIAEEVDLGTPEIVAKIARKNLSKVARNIKATEPESVVVDGRNWQRFNVTCDVEDIPFFYQFQVYAGPEGTYQIVSWTFQNLAEKQTARMNEVAETFVFPKTNGPAADAK